MKCHVYQGGDQPGEMGDALPALNIEVCYVALGVEWVVASTDTVLKDSSIPSSECKSHQVKSMSYYPECVKDNGGSNWWFGPTFQCLKPKSLQNQGDPG